MTKIGLRSKQNYPFSTRLWPLAKKSHVPITESGKGPAVCKIYGVCFLRVICSEYSITFQSNPIFQFFIQEIFQSLAFPP